MGSSASSLSRRKKKGGKQKDRSNKNAEKLRKLLEETTLQDICEKQNIVVLKDNATVEQALKVRLEGGQRGVCV